MHPPNKKPIAHLLHSSVDNQYEEVWHNIQQDTTMADSIQSCNFSTMKWNCQVLFHVPRKL